MTNQLGKIEDTVGTTFGLRTWIEYGFKHAKDQAALGRLSGDRVCRYRAVVGTGHERLYPSTLVSLQTAEVAALAHLAPPPSPPGALGPLETHPAWDTRTGWKHHLNNLRLLLQPYVCSCLFLSVPVCSCPGLPLSRSDMRKRSRPVSPRSAHSSTPSAWRSQHDR